MHTPRSFLITYKNGSNLLADQLGWSLNVIISQEVKIVLDILDAKSQTNADAEWAVIVDIKYREFVANDTRSLGKRRGVDG